MARRLLWAVWMLCAASIAATFVMAIYEAAHPLIDPGHRNLGAATIFVVPYVVVGATASVLRRRPAWLALLLAQVPQLAWKIAIFGDSLGQELTQPVCSWLRVRRFHAVL